MAAPFQRKIRTAGLIGKYQSPEVAESLPLLAAFLRERGVRVLIEEKLAGSVKVSGGDTASYETMGSEADVAIVLGGDGTMLYAARRLAEFGVPLAGVNLGRLGFMTDIARHDMLAGVSDLLAGKFTAESRVLLEAEVWRGGERVFGNLAFNEVVVNKGDLGRMIEMKVEVDGEFLYVLRADGIIACTPTGSTAYALSANGPILHPGVAGIALVPLCPHALSNRPITIGDDCRVEITLVPPHDGRVHVDGQARYDALTGDCVRIGRSRFAATLLHPPGYDYYTMLREKLHWSEPPKH
ncbi:MAG TPA: NAD(+)/NADH kinase [Rhodocyclaceae bacterium]|nr:NAD(+)/NADH kinase [Rhodocyclaceae bacterium]